MMIIIIIIWFCNFFLLSKNQKLLLMMMVSLNETLTEWPNWLTYWIWSATFAKTGQTKQKIFVLEKSTKRESKKGLRKKRNKDQRLWLCEREMETLYHRRRHIILLERKQKYSFICQTWNSHRTDTSYLMIFFLFWNIFGLNFCCCFLQKDL